MNRSFRWQVEVGVPYWRQNRRLKPWTVRHDFADFGPETGDSALGYWLTVGLLQRPCCLIEMPSLMKVRLALNLDRHLSHFQVKATLWLILQVNQRN